MYMRLKEDLSEIQIRAIRSKANSTLVIAGAGSGKTRVLIQRALWLIQECFVPSDSLMILAFNGCAVEELRNKIFPRVKNGNEIWLGTFDTIAARMIRENLSLGSDRFSRNFNIIDHHEVQKILARILVEEKIPATQLSLTDAVHQIKRHKDQGLRAGDLSETTSSNKQKAFRQIYQRYEKFCSHYHLMDFSEIALKAYEMLNENREIAVGYARLIKHILIDEYQDFTRTQSNIIRLLVENGSSILAVGDDDQKISCPISKDIGPIKNFSSHFQNSEILNFSENYRSQEKIVVASKKLITNNTNRLPKSINSLKESGQLIRLYIAENDYREASHVANKIFSLYKKNEYKYSDIAVLYRSNAQSHLIEQSCIAAGIPTRRFSGVKFYERDEIRTISGYLSLLDTRSDDIAFSRVINIPLRGIGEKTVEKLAELANKHNISLWQGSIDFQSEFTKRIQDSFAEFRSKIEELHRLRETGKISSLHNLIEHIIDDCDLDDFYRRERQTVYEARLKSIKELKELAIKHENYSRSKSLDSMLHSFLTEILFTENGYTNASENAEISLMTVHQAKGLEFKVVFLMGLEEGLFPHFSAKQSPSSLESERRLFYLGITRCKELLFLTHARKRVIGSSVVKTEPSRFLKEIPEELISKSEPKEPEDVIRKGKFIASTSAALHKKEPQKKQENPYQIGKKIQHNSFGMGIIQDRTDNGERIKVLIEFSNKSQKWFLASAKALRPFGNKDT